MLMNTISCVRHPEGTKIQKVPRHSHPYWEIILNLEGDFCSTIGNKIYQLKQGDISVIPPHVLHDGSSQNGYRDIFLQAKQLDFFDVAVVQDTEGAVHQLMNQIGRAHV